MTLPPIKSCPFCAGEEVYFRPTRGWDSTFGECRGCGASGPDGPADDMAGAVAAWNNQAPREYTIDPTKYVVWYNCEDGLIHVAPAERKGE